MALCGEGDLAYCAALRPQSGPLSRAEDAPSGCMPPLLARTAWQAEQDPRDLSGDQLPQVVLSKKSVNKCILVVLYAETIYAYVQQV